MFQSGTFPTCREVRFESAFGSKAEVGVSSPTKGSLWRTAVIRNADYPHTSVLRAEQRLSPRKNNIEI
jgi:hypothetical protein